MVALDGGEGQVKKIRGEAFLPCCTEKQVNPANVFKRDVYA